MILFLKKEGIKLDHSVNLQEKKTLFRTDQVGSLLRSDKVKAARLQKFRKKNRANPE
jgi:hypothetical protein